MQQIRKIELKKENSEELLPGFSDAFPYIATCAQLDGYMKPDIPWHWHRQVELFYIRSGSLEYITPHGSWIFHEGMGGMVNANVLHRSRLISSEKENVQWLHIFDPLWLSGGTGDQMEKKYIFPLVADRDLEMVVLHPEKTEEAVLIDQIRKAFAISDQEWGYEFRIREELVQIWLGLLKLLSPAMPEKTENRVSDEKMKSLMIYIQEHFSEPIAIEQLAELVHVSKRSCFRLFQENLHMSPVEYIQSIRLQQACRMLKEEQCSVTAIAQECGFGSSSYFGKIFRREVGCTPQEYRGRSVRQKEHR